MPASSRIGGRTPLISRRASKWPCCNIVLPAANAFIAASGLRVPQMGEGLELHNGAGQLLGKPVVNLIGDHLPFVVAGLQQVPEGLLFSLQVLLGLLPGGNVLHEAN